MKTTISQIGVRLDNKETREVDDILTVEEALQININGKPYTLTMRTPGQDEFLVRGLLFTENIATKNQQTISIHLNEDKASGLVYSADVLVSPDDINYNFLYERTLYAGSSCGLCGKRETDDIVVEGPPLISDESIGISLLMSMFDQMNRQQATFNRTGGSHASAAFTSSGELLALQEDIGRHNAVDKVIGQLLLSGHMDNAFCLVVSGRLSYEIVTKTYRAGIPILAAVSAPSSLAVQTADRLGITLAGFCRDNRATVYSTHHRIQNIAQECQKI